MGGTLQGERGLPWDKRDCDLGLQSSGWDNSGTRALESVYMGSERRWLSKRVTGTKARASVENNLPKECLGAGLYLHIQYRNSLDPNRPKDVGSGEGWWTQLWS